MEENTVTENKDNIETVFIKDEMKNCYLDYAMSVIIGRALPDVRDGMKPVHRRILYAMHMLGNVHNKSFLKSARIVGDVIGKYHPHGDSAVYNTMVRMAQNFSMRYQLIDGQGNFGSIDGDSPAAMRYTEVRMKKLSEEMLRDIDKETVDWQPNYDDSLVEPQVIPTKIPNLLVNGTSGIAVGMATNIPPHNLNEIMQGLKAVLDHKDISWEELIGIIRGPDFPTGGVIHGVEGIKSAYRTGRGIIQIRGCSDVEIFSKGRERLVITELPYQVNKAKFIEKIAELVNSKQISGISDIRDESNKEGIRICLDLKKDAISKVVLNSLYKQTQLQISFGVIFLSIYKGLPKIMNLKEQLQAFIDHRKEIVTRRTMYLLKKAKEKEHILLGLKTVVENIDALIVLIKKSDSPDKARENIISKYSLSRIQAQAILDMKLQRLTGLERDKILSDHENIVAEIGKLEGILGSDEQIKGIIRTEFDEIIENYGDDRKTEIVARADEIQIEDLVKRENVIVTITHKGYIKRMNLDTYKTQRRGGTGVKGITTRDDFFSDIFVANTHANLFFFTSKGTVFSKKVYTIPEGTRTNMGRNIANLLEVPPGETIKEVICVDDMESHEGKYLVFATAKGIFKRTSLSEYRRIPQSGLRAIKVIDGDNIVKVRITDGSKDVLLYSSSGQSIRFEESSCRPIGRVSQGVKGISLSKNEQVVGMEIMDSSDEILSITESGFGKRTAGREYRLQGRGGKGIIGMKLTARNGKITAIKTVAEKDDLVIITDKGQVIRVKVSNIPCIGRSTQGVRVIKLKPQEKVVAIEKIVDPVDIDAK